MTDEPIGAPNEAAPSAALAPIAPVPPAAPTGRTPWIAIAALVAGQDALVLVLVFFMTDAASEVVWPTAALGLIGVVLGVLALRWRQSKVMAIIGLATGGFALLAMVALLLFALLFVGALTLS